MSSDDFLKPSVGKALLIDGKRAAEIQTAQVAAEAQALARDALDQFPLAFAHGNWPSPLFERASSPDRANTPSRDPL